MVIDLTGHTYGKLKCIERSANNKHGKAQWLCQCQCGNDVVVLANSLRTGRQVSCGCHKRLNTSKRNRKHGMTGTKIYDCWKNMVRRCHSPSSTFYERYGGRGISVCERWRGSFENFIEDMGTPSEGFEIERVDNDLDYCKDNCKWANKTEQCNNRSSNILIEYLGEYKTLTQWQNDLGFDYETVRRRIRDYGWTFENAITKPKRSRR
jgi:hypothetical protein